MILRENLCYVIVRDKLSFVELSEYPFSKRLFDCFEVKLREARGYAVLPVSVRDDSVKVRVKV